MINRELRDAIATEAARLILRRKVVEYHAARLRAARWMSKRKLSPQEMPTNAEIQAKVEALACLFAEEQAALSGDTSSLFDEVDEETSGDDYHPDTFPLLQILMS